MQLVNKNPSPADLHKFGWAMLAGFGVLGVLLWWVWPDPNTLAWTGAGHQKAAIALWALGAVLWAISFGPKVIARPVYVGWMSTAMVIGTIMSVVMLSVLFIVFLPIFSLIRLSDPLRMKLAPPGASYWEDHVHHESTLERTARPF